MESPRGRGVAKATFLKKHENFNLTKEKWKFLVNLCAMQGNNLYASSQMVLLFYDRNNTLGKVKAWSSECPPMVDLKEYFPSTLLQGQ